MEGEIKNKPRIFGVGKCVPHFLVTFSPSCFTLSVEQQKETRRSPGLRWNDPALQCNRTCNQCVCVA